MPPRRAVLFAVLGVLLLGLLAVVAFLVGRAATGGAGPTSAATSVAQATPAQATAAPTQAATPTSVSATVAPTARPTPTPAPTGQTILSFNVPQTFKCDAGGQANPYVHLSWTTVNATGVSISIDGPGKFADYPANGSADVPFACSVAQHTYLLTTQGTGSPATRTVVVRRVT